MEALVLTFLLVSTLGIIFFAIFLETRLRFRLKSKNERNFLNNAISVMNESPILGHYFN